ncbi:Phosphatidylinositol glycan anchor biosynthesis class U protein [Hypsibius exemplaris]|uniref:Phosphatidylinositol glycan anchor biosynthesis class U protein n=1 Tax=Hypsibius exemplaris TaxID=2072580 RepID=A0A1W0WC13_HYPEX|nr:Phosphatidylinositol glycan anchor biosynthesis class U protein [Hypsibius exemplaris]
MELAVLVGAAAAGFALRSGLIFSDLPKLVSQRVEFSVPTNSWQRVLEGSFLYDSGVDPYSGDIFHETPLCLVLFAVLKKRISCFGIDLIFPVLDVVTAFLLFFFARNLVQDTIVSEQKAKEKHASGTSKLLVPFADIVTVPRMVLLWYLFNPHIIGSCLEKTTSVFTNFLLAAMLLSASQGPSLLSRLSSLFFLALATYQTLYMFLLFPALHLYLLQNAPEKCRSSRKFHIARLVIHLGIFGGILAALVIGSSVIMGSWSFIRGVYGFAVFAPDLTPNIGLFWYFFTEMFEQFRTFFTWIFFLNICIYSVPVSIKLRHDPPFAIFTLLSLITIFKPYPSYGDVGFYLSLFPIWKRLYPHMRQSLVVVVMLLVAAVLFPILWKLWIEVGSANANFFYAITLVFVASQVFFVTDIMLAHEKREWHLMNGMKSDVDANGKAAELLLD